MKFQSMILNKIPLILASYCAKVIPLTKLIFSTLWGWITLAASTLIIYLNPILGMFCVLGILVLLDWLLACCVKRKYFVSNKIWDTLLKLLFYIMIIGFIFTVEEIVALPVLILTPIIFTISALAEGWSCLANACILDKNNNIPVLRIFKKLLTSEITKKTEGILTQEEIEAILDNTKKKK